MLPKKWITISLLVALMILPTMILSAQGGRWDGADDLAVEPLACPGNADAARPATIAAYDGGQPENRPDLAGQAIILVNVPTDDQTNYHRLIQQGMSEAGDELRNVQFVGNLPTVADSGDQLNLLGGIASSQANGVLVNVADYAAISPALGRLLQSGKHVITYEADSQPNTREWFVQPVQPNALAKTLVDRLVAEAGSSGTFAIMTGSYDDPVTSRWVAEMWAYARACYPDLEWLETVEAQGDEVIAFNLAATLLNQYPDDLNGILSLVPVGTPNAAEAVKRAGLCGDVAVVGLAMPVTMQPYVEAGCVKSVVFWNPVDVGYAAVYAMRRAIDGELRPGSDSVSAGRLGELQVIGSHIVLGPPLVADATNISDFDF